MSLQQMVRSAGSFKAALGSVAASVNVITMWDADRRPLGMTATAFSSVSVDPLLVLVCVNRSTRTYEHIADSGHFGVNVLGAAAHDISDHCGRPGGDKVLDPSWLADSYSYEWQSPALRGALAFLDCSVDQSIAAGTHAVFIGAVEGIGLSSVAHNYEPLLHFRGRYRQMSTTRPSIVPRPLPIALEELA